MGKIFLKTKNLFLCYIYYIHMLIYGEDSAMHYGDLLENYQI